MNEENFKLKQKSKRQDMARTFRRGVKRICSERKYTLIFFIAVLLVVGCVCHAIFTPSTGRYDIRDILAPWYIIIGIAALVVVVYCCGYLWGKQQIQDNLQRAGIVNSVGEAPTLIDRQCDKRGMVTLTFNANGIPLTEWVKEADYVASALGLIVYQMTEGAEPHTIVVCGFRPEAPLPECIEWDGQSSAERAVLRLGISRSGIVEIDLDKTPHWLVAAATGMGKTQLLVLLIQQLLAKQTQIKIADWKGGIDYSHAIRRRVDFVDNYETLLGLLKDALNTVQQRKEMYNREMERPGNENVACNNLREFEALSGIVLPHIVIIIDEASMVFDANTKADKAAAAEVLSLVNLIARGGRALGVHLIVATQRPDVASIPGSVKGNLDGRICGHTADNTSSIVVLDNADAAALPAIPGRFILKDVGYQNRVFQAFLP